MENFTWNVVDLTREFVQCDTVTPKDNGLQSKILSYLKEMGFKTHLLPFGEIHNFYARVGATPPLFCFAGHTDVVPAGPEENWTFPPFSAQLKEGRLYGRGTADMKGAIAAMISAVHKHLKRSSLRKGSIAFLMTGDEEGPAVEGTVKVMEWLKQKGEKIDYCLVGEPTSETQLGDTIKNGRRGSINGRLTLYGIQGHVAYPHLAENPLHKGLEILRQLIRIPFDQGNVFFDPTHITLTNIQGGSGRDNVIPDRVETRFNIRYGTASTFHSIKEKIETMLVQSGVKFSLEFQHAGEAFLTSKGVLIQSIIQSVEEITGVTPKLSTGGGTSDARFIAPMGIEAAELGLKSGTIHKTDESVSTEDLMTLERIYKKILERILV
ncbi:MAG: succinyl-diaminopimelate desuccinylase [Nitrospiria bacterium]